MDLVGTWCRLCISNPGLKSVLVLQFDLVLFQTTKSWLKAIADLMLWSTLLDSILLVLVLVAVSYCWWRLRNAVQPGARLLVNGEVWGGRAYRDRARARIQAIESEL